MPKDKLLYAGLFCVILVISAVFFIGRSGGGFVILPPPSGPAAGEPQVRIGNAAVTVELARTSEEVQRGLSGRMSLPESSGLLFIFGAPDRYRFWMPDMYFPIDIIWINGGKVVDISADVSNEFDPLKPKFYSPREPAQYVLEVNAGFAARHGIRIGDEVHFAYIQ